MQQITRLAAVFRLCRNTGLLAILALAGLAANNVFAAADEELLDPEIAFTVSADALDADTLAVDYKIADGYYLYRHRLNYTTNTPGITLGEPRIPAGEKKHDEFFGDVETYRHTLRVLLPFRITGENPGIMNLQAGLQGCADIGVCFPPSRRSVDIALAGLPVASLKSDSTGFETPATETPYIAEQDRITNTLAEGRTLLILLSFFGFGLLLTFTPCVFPMIPILSGIIIGQGKDITTARAFVLSVVYVLAMALTYTIVGVLVGLSGENIQALFQNAWVLGAFAAVFVLLSLSMFGFYELQMPAAVQSKLTTISNSQNGGTLLGVAIMGFLSALIVGPCVTAPLIGALIYIAQTGDAVLGGMALFALSMGMGAPLIAIGASAGKLLPRAGAWMNAVKAVFGVLLLAVAVWLLERVLPGPVVMALWAVLLIVPAIYMGALDNLSHTASGWSRLWKGVGLLMLIYGILLLIGASSGSNNPFKPLHQLTSAGISSRGGIDSAKLQFEPIKGMEGLQHALAIANNENKPVMLDFYADWCISCKEMEAFTFSDAGVQDMLSGFKRLKADVTPNDDLDKALLKEFGLFGPPAILFFAPDGEELRQFRVVGFMPKEDFTRHVRIFLETLASR